MKNLPVIWIIFVASYGSCRQLPSAILQCDLKSDNFNGCLTEEIPHFIRQLTKPQRKWGLPSLDPLIIPAISIDPEPGPLGFEQNYTDFKLWGLTLLRCSDIKFDFEGNKMTMNCSTPQLKIETDYLFNGTIGNVIPLYGNGTGKIVLDKVTCYHVYDFKEYSKKGRRHLKVTNSSLSINPSHITYQFDNLYNGENEELLGNNINLVMNDNWREVWVGLKRYFDIAFTRVFQALFNSLLQKVSLPELFING